MIRDPALRFLVEYVEAAGGLCESDVESAEIVLTPALARSFGLPEALVVTSDPDIAADEGATLLTAGHPALDVAVRDVLGQGDAGIAYLAWPTSAQPTRATLLEHARDRIAVEHGRIDATRDPVPVYYPLLRVGALVTYTLDERFEECEEVWVDALSAMVLAADVVRSVRFKELMPRPDRALPNVAFELVRAVAAAHASLDARAARRADAFERQARRSLGDEQSRAQQYYDAVLAGIAQRRASATPERLRLLDAQAEATETERRRRLREIAAKFEAARTISPYRLNLIFVPAFTFDIEVRRGERRYPLRLCWLTTGAGFATPGCPKCAATQPLVAGRTQLECRSCSGPAGGAY